MEDEVKLKVAIIFFKNFIKELETQHANSKLLQLFKEQGLYRMLYHAPLMKHEEDDSGLMEGLKAGFIGVGLSAIFVALFVAAPFLALPFWATVITTGLFAASVTYISTLIYGVVNDYYATRANLPYFLLGHQPQQHSMLPTNDPLTQGIAWGVAATFGPAVLAGIAFGVAAAITAIRTRSYICISYSVSRHASNSVWCRTLCSQNG